jgi:circadian clock protein KaiC
MGLNNRVITGVEGFDKLVEGGFPRNSVIIIAGGPGAGKTIFSAQYIHHGALNGEKGVYVSFGETAEIFKEYMQRFSLDFQKLEKDGKAVILDLTVPKLGLETNLDLIEQKVRELGAKRLVVDSFSAIALALGEKVDVRTTLHMLTKLFRELNCTTIMVVDISIGSKNIGTGLEEFLADGIVILDTSLASGQLQRNILIRKMRGTNHSIKTCPYLITDQGIVIIE